jgi:tryptophan synthase alpha chain
MADGPGRLADAFAAARGAAFIPYVMGGYPDPATSAERAVQVAAFADVLEIGVPFSDPLADGPTIQAAGQAALDAGTTPDTVLEIAAQAARVGPPIVLMTYVNIVLCAGPRAFCERAAKAGVSGLIIPDLPIDEGDEVRTQARRAGLAVVPLAAPTTTNQRLAQIGRVGEGFLYCVSAAGVTGGSVEVGEELRDFLARARQHVALPLAVGFGVRTPGDAAKISEVADGVVIASQLIRLADDAGSRAAASPAVDDYCASVVEAIRATDSAPRATPAS